MFLIPGLDMDLDVESFWVVEDFLTLEECQTMIDLGESVGFHQSAINHPSGTVLDLRTRNNERAIMDNPSTAGWLFDRLKEHLPPEMFGCPLEGLNERIRFYRYGPGHYFTPHRDGILNLPDGRMSCLTLLIYLNDGFEGGETTFRDLEETIIPKPGMALLFQHRLVHEGKTVTAGRKYVLRSDVMYRVQG